MRSSTFIDPRIELTYICGYLRKQDINMTSDYLSVSIETPVARVAAHDGTGEIKVYDVSDTRSTCIATLLDGTLVIVWGTIYDWYYINTGYISGFVKHQDLQPSGIPPMFSHEVPELGTLELNTDLDRIYYHSYPSLSAPISVGDQGSAFEGDQEPYVARLDGWYEVKTPSGRLEFIHEQYVRHVR